IDKRPQIHAVVETIYPGAVADWARRESLAITSLETLAARQTGMYRRVDQLSNEQRTKLVEQVCERCVRHPTWFDGTREPIPCAEACNWWLSRALDEDKA
ncbi:MAG TPA: hypothetical protein VHD90_03775, partial [Phototrophicaceae bacterium]|nr:hypothetical protein [Phototrophicaceae bacterium]